MSGTTPSTWLGELRDAHEAARRLGRELRGLEASKRPAFLDQLLVALLQERHAYGVALFLLERLTDRATLEKLHERLRPLPGLQTDEEESHLADLIRILAATGDRSMTPAVEDYLLQREPSSQWSTVPWALWPHNCELFARAWLRYFGERDPADWTGTFVVRSFLSEPAAIDVVKQQLSRAAPERWALLRKALLHQAGSASWLSVEDRAELDRSLE
jgi:hypothetical protein